MPNVSFGPKSQRDYGRAKKWTEIFWVLIQACYHKLIFHLLLNNNRSVNPIPIHLQPDGVLICRGHFISCWQFHKPFKAFSLCNFPPSPRDRQLPSRFLQPFLPVFGGVCCVIFTWCRNDLLPFFNYIVFFSVFLTCHWYLILLPQKYIDIFLKML